MQPNPSTAGPEGLVRQISAFGVALVALNGMIGAGIFGVPAGAAALVLGVGGVVYLLNARAMGAGA